jgi:hypothetical protein
LGTPVVAGVATLYLYYLLLPAAYTSVTIQVQKLADLASMAAIASSWSSILQDVTAGASNSVTGATEIGVFNGAYSCISLDGMVLIGTDPTLSTSLTGQTQIGGTVLADKSMFGFPTSFQLASSYNSPPNQLAWEWTNPSDAGQISALLE